MGGMSINFNNIRKQAIYAYDRLTEKLNDAVIKNNDEHAKPNNYNHSTNLNGFVLIDADEIQKDMESLRSLIGSIAMVYEDGDENFKDVFQEVFPEENQHMKYFNEEEEN